ncbi:kinase-like protein [Gyrodon lividus]|nr:kinase-like protein [Gyrodon lividus]
MRCTGDNPRLLDFSGQIIDRYFLICMIGFGTHGRVYRAVDTTSHPYYPRYYAIKCLSKIDLTPERLFQQARELTIHKRVSGSSPYVLSLHDIIEEELYTYLVLDLSESDLYDVVTSKVYHYNDHLIRQAFIEILDGVQACHEQGVFHRDLKLENILCRKDGTGTLIADFGLATRKRVCREFGCGTSYYMSPECLSRDFVYPHYFPRYTDIWSLGIILLAMVTGRPPWQLATPSDEDFFDFLHNEDYLYETLGISRPLNGLLNRVFNLDPLARISIPELREEIIEIDTFYMCFEGLRAAPRCFREVHTTYNRRVPIAIPVSYHTMERTLVDPYDSRGYYLESDDDITHRDWSNHSSEHIIALREPAEPLSGSYGSFYAEICGRTRVLAMGHDSGSSGFDSEGPITPETFSHDLVALDVEDLPEEETLGEGIGAHDLMSVGKPRVKEQRPMRRNTFRNIFGRLIGR